MNEPEVIVVDPNEPEVNPPAPEPEEPPVVIVEPPAPPAPPSPMPSGVSQEAWKNVEELLVTLSNNLRVNVGQLREDIRQSVEDGRSLNAKVVEELNRLNTTMEEFTTLLRNATVEVPPTNNEPEPQKKGRSGFLSRKGR